MQLEQCPLIPIEVQVYKKYTMKTRRRRRAQDKKMKGHQRDSVAYDGMIWYWKMRVLQRESLMY